MGIPFLGDLIAPITSLVSEVVVDKDKRDQINFQLQQLSDQAQARLDEMVAAQIDVNKVEASNPSIFVAGWRPAVGWVGAFGLAYSTIIEPFMEFAAKTVFHYAGAFPEINTEVLMTALMGMLGIGTMRSVEKVKGVATTIVGNRPPTPISNPLPADSPAPKKKHFHIF